MLLKNRILCFLPWLAGTIDYLVAQARVSRGSSNGASKGHIGYVECCGVLDPNYTRHVGQQIWAAANDESVRCIVLYINSPGGLTEGTPELAEIIRRAAAIKPVHVIVEGYLASAALWVASQATTITASPSAVVGSIGAMIVLLDDSEMFARLGVKVLRISSGPLKGTGIPGVKVEDAEIAAIRRQIDMLTAMFEAAIMRGRKMSAAQVNKIATGETWLAQQAKNLGLIDRVALFEDALADVVRQQLGPSPAADPYAHLQGYAAEKQWFELAAEECGIGLDRFGNLDREPTADEQRKLTAKYPALAKAAASF